jgi:hypothetical protein
MRDGSRNLSHILISRRDEDLIPAFTIGDVDYLIFPRVSAESIVKLTTAESTVTGMRDYILANLAKEDQRTTFASLMNDIDVEGLGLIIEEIVARTTPFDSTKPNG